MHVSERGICKLIVYVRGSQRYKIAKGRTGVRLSEKSIGKELKVLSIKGLSLKFGERKQPASSFLCICLCICVRWLLKDVEKNARRNETEGAYQKTPRTIERWLNAKGGIYSHAHTFPSTPTYSVHCVSNQGKLKTLYKLQTL